MITINFSIETIVKFLLEQIVLQKEVNVDFELNLVCVNEYILKVQYFHIKQHYERDLYET